MKICLSARQNAKYLKEADEIKFQYRDRKAIVNFFEKYNQKTFILECNHFLDDEIDWKEIIKINVLLKNNLILSLNSLEDVKAAKDNNIKFYLNYPIKTAYELEGIATLGAEYILLDAPLFFKLDLVKKYNIPIRAIPNIAFSDGLPRKNGFIGTWIRPEDLSVYEEYISVIEFGNTSTEKEQTLYNIYVRDKQWPGPLNLLIENIGSSNSNHLLATEFTKNRINCGQSCIENNSNCRICQRMINLANEKYIKEYLELLERAK